MFARVTVTASDRDASERFYATVLRTLGVEPTSTAAWQDFSVGQADSAAAVTRRLHIGFVAPLREHVDAFWRAGTGAGHPDAGAPGPRPQYREDYYGAFVLDPDGNSAEAVHHGAMRRGGVVDHLWLRVPDVAAARDFYAALIPHADVRLERDTPEHVLFAGDSGSFSLVPGEATENAHLVFDGPGEGSPLREPQADAAGNTIQVL